MNILNIEHVSKIFGEKVIFDDVSYGIHQGDKIGIIGINGTGKTNHIKNNKDRVGMETGMKDRLLCRTGFASRTFLRIRNFPRMPRFLIMWQMESAEDWATASEAANILNKLGITDHEEKIEHLSGGQKKRVALARTLVNPADV